MKYFRTEKTLYVDFHRYQYRKTLLSGNAVRVRPVPAHLSKLLVSGMSRFREISGLNFVLFYYYGGNAFGTSQLGMGHTIAY